MKGLGKDGALCLWGEEGCLWGEEPKKVRMEHRWCWVTQGPEGQNKDAIFSREGRSWGHTLTPDIARRAHHWLAVWLVDSYLTFLYFRFFTFKCENSNSEMKQDSMILATTHHPPPHHVFCLSLACGKL